MTPKKRVRKIGEAFGLTRKFFPGALSNGDLKKLIGVHAERSGNIISYIKFPVTIGETLHSFWLTAWQKGGGLSLYLWIGKEWRRQDVREVGEQWKNFVSKSIAGVDIDTRDETPHRLAAHYGQPISENI